MPSERKEEREAESLKEDIRRGRQHTMPFDKYRKPLKILTVKDMSEADGKINELVERIDGGYYCKVCEYSSGSSSHVKEHVQRHIEGLSYNCKFCEKNFDLKYKLRSHIRLQHKEEKNHRPESLEEENLLEENLKDVSGC